MPNTEHFYVSHENKVKRSSKTDRELFKKGLAKYTISIFGDNHKNAANEVKKMIENAGMSEKILGIHIEMK